MGTKMGEWKIEERGDKGEIWNEQFYEIDDNVRGSGIRKEDMDIQAIREGRQLHTNRLFTVKQGFRTGRFELVGTMNKHPVNMAYKPKRTRKYPKYIEEIPKSRMMSF